MPATNRETAKFDAFNPETSLGSEAVHGGPPFDSEPVAHAANGESTSENLPGSKAQGSNPIRVIV